MKCYKCPCIKEQFDDRVQRLDGTDICGYIEWDEVDYDHVSYCYCEKMGHPLYGGRCQDAECITEKEWDEYRELNGMPPIQKEEPLEQEIEPIPEPTKKQKKRYRDKKYQRHLKGIFYRNHFLSGAYPVNKEGEYDPDNPVRYKREYNPPRARWIKRHCNKRIRRRKDVPNRGGYHKASEYWWELW